LKSIVLDKSGLEWMQSIILSETFNGRDSFALVHNSKGQAGEHASAIDQHGTGSALTVITALFCARQTNILVQSIKQANAWRRLGEECVVSNQENSRVFSLWGYYRCAFAPGDRIIRSNDGLIWHIFQKGESQTNEGVLMQDVPNSPIIVANSSTIWCFGLSIISTRQSTCLAVCVGGIKELSTTWITKAMALRPCHPKEELLWPGFLIFPYWKYKETKPRVLID
jgi:hypothetical protein